jgi:hypothetical protein
MKYQRYLSFDLVNHTIYDLKNIVEENEKIEKIEEIFNDQEKTEENSRRR